MGSISAYASETYQFQTGNVIVGSAVDEHAVTDKKDSLVTPAAPIFIGDKLSASLTLASPLAANQTTHLSAESGPFDLIGNNGTNTGNVQAYSTSVIDTPHSITSDLNQYHPTPGATSYIRYSTLDGDITTDASGKISTWDLNFALLKAPGGAPFGINTGTNPPTFIGDSPSQQAAYLHLTSDPNADVFHIYNVSLLNGMPQAPQTYTFSGKDTAFVDSRGQFHFYTSPVPEPSTWALMIAGLGLLGGWQQRRLRRD